MGLRQVVAAPAQKTKKPKRKNHPPKNKKTTTIKTNPSKTTSTQPKFAKFPLIERLKRIKRLNKMIGREGILVVRVRKNQVCRRRRRWRGIGLRRGRLRIR